MADDGGRQQKERLAIGGDLEQQWRLACALRQRANPTTLCSLLRALGSDGLMAPSSQQALLQNWAGGSPLAELLPPDVDHQRRVLRAVVLAAEQDGQEVCEELMQLYSARLLGQAGAVGGGSSTALLAAPQPQPGWCYKLYGYAPAGEPTAATWHRMGVLDRQAVERCQQEQQHWRQELDGQQQGEEDGEPGLLPPLPVTAGDARHGLLALHVSLNLLEGGTGCHEWEAGFWLAEWVLSHPQLAAGRCCLEIGCGAGMVGVALHRCGAAAVVCTDGDAQTVANCRLNLQLNGVPLLAARDGPADAAPAVLAAAPAQEDGSNVEMQQQQPAAYIATTLRNEATLHQFLVAAESDPAIYIQQLAGPAARSSAGKAAAAGGVEEGAAGRDGGCDASRGGSSPAIRFQHVPELEAARSRIFLHRITLAP
ncbi:hypothetical protein CHLNCDRAFT_133128 [Chlorella variabilis]|uniref:Methyltransferase small domain-containing protein n=1 Tax=Chlorella variabilis TaxID=554065 RepID=E1Z2F0_CHLVA|nr:hypothetical protein CHLNCDRAFT_133128 [Chlorella variabilis]EFN59648.1 hypothetical protein CHLNCDRAFT_133128 [Chlorella variabilis]|eukprot:XP_005851750.1 hypothetical protein CHLNCDRAFT_133128 [Chlorella variabilis]